MTICCRKIAVLLLFLLFAVSPGIASENRINTRQSELSNLLGQIEKTEQRLSTTRRAEHSLHLELKEIENELSTIRKRQKKLHNKTREIEKQIKEGKDLEQKQLRESNRLKIKVKERLIVLYQHGKSGFIQVLFSSDSPASALEDYNYFKRIIRNDHKLLKQYRNSLAEFDRQQQELQILQKQYSAVEKATAKDNRNLRAAIKRREQLLGEMRQDRSILAGQLQSLQGKARKLKSLIKRLVQEKLQQTAKLPDNYFVQLKGKLPWPVTGRVRVGFGRVNHPKLGTIDNKGYEFAVPPGTPVQAIADGRVIFANEFKGYGKLIILSHGGKYYSLYAQNRRLLTERGTSVRQGDKIALSGYENQDLFYFEIRHQEVPQNPKKWLKLQ